MTADAGARHSGSPAGNISTVAQVAGECTSIAAAHAASPRVHQPALDATRGILSMGKIVPGTALSLQCLGTGSGGNQGTYLDGLTAARAPAPSVGLATATVEPFTGTRWLALPIQGAPPNQVYLQCLGDIAGPRFLDGRTETGTVGLAPTTAAQFTGTRWQVNDAGSDEVTLVCLGASTAGSNVRFLRGVVGQGAVGLVDFGGLPATLWRIVDAQPAPVGTGVTSAASNSGPALLFAASGVGGSRLPLYFMAWRGLDGRVGVMADMLNAPQTVSLGHRCLDRPALALDTRTNTKFLAWTGVDQSINVMSSADGLVYDGRVMLPGKSRFGPAITIFRNQPVVAWMDAATGVLTMANGLGGAQVATAETGSAAPALAAEAFVDGTDALIVAWTGTNAERQLNVMNSSQGGFPPSTKVTLPSDGPSAATSISGPSLDFRQGTSGTLLVMGWTSLPGGPDRDNHLNIIFSGDLFRLFDQRRTVAPVSGAGLAIARDPRAVDGNMFGAWVDRQSRINAAFYNDLPVIPA
jgi:hypothetical protein